MVVWWYDNDEMIDECLTNSMFFLCVERIRDGSGLLALMIFSFCSPFWFFVQLRWEHGKMGGWGRCGVGEGGRYIVLW